MDMHTLAGIYASDIRLALARTDDSRARFLFNRYAQMLKRAHTKAQVELVGDRCWDLARQYPRMWGLFE